MLKEMEAVQLFEMGAVQLCEIDAVLLHQMECCTFLSQGSYVVVCCCICIDV